MLKSQVSRRVVTRAVLNCGAGAAWTCETATRLFPRAISPSRRVPLSSTPCHDQTIHALKVKCSVTSTNHITWYLIYYDVKVVQCYEM